jgi:hypothetical protein
MLCINLIQGIHPFTFVVQLLHSPLFLNLTQTARNASGQERSLYSMTQGKSPAGICHTCNNVEVCSQRPGFMSPVFYCEQFDCSSEPMPEVQMSITTKLKEEVDITMGLCCNCGNRNSCTSTKTPGGIWHCEEYA